MLFQVNQLPNSKLLAPSIDESPFSSTTPPPKNDTCQCQGKESGRLAINELEEEARIRFEDEVHNKVYIKR